MSNKHHGLVLSILPTLQLFSASSGKILAEIESASQGSSA
jgi:hypothetical protein